MVYSSEAVLPTDLDYGAPRIRAYDEQGAKASHEDAMDQLDEARDVTVLARPSTSRRYNGTTANGCGTEPSMSGT